MKPFYTVFLLLVTSSCFAHYKERPAQLITRRQGTLPGLVRDDDWHKNPTLIEFLDKQSRLETVPVRAIEK